MNAKERHDAIKAYRELIEIYQQLKREGYSETTLLAFSESLKTLEALLTRLGIINDI
jgi:hypothetical protein